MVLIIENQKYSWKEGIGHDFVYQKLKAITRFIESHVSFIIITPPSHNTQLQILYKSQKDHNTIKYSATNVHGEKKTSARR